LVWIAQKSDMEITEAKIHVFACRARMEHRNRIIKLRLSLLKQRQQKLKGEKRATTRLLTLKQQSKELRNDMENNVEVIAGY